MPKSFKKTLNPEEVKEAKKVQVATLQRQCYALERMTAISTSQQLRLAAEIDGLQRRIAINERNLEAASKALDDDVTTMRNMSTNSEEQLKQQYDRLVKTRADAEEDVKMARRKLEETQGRRHADYLKWVDEVLALQQQMDEMALLFGMRLRETLERTH